MNMKMINYHNLDMRMRKLQKKVDSMYWDYDRLSRSGQETLDEMADLVGLETQEEEAQRKGSE
mgnify:CR=1 FL=1